MTTIKVSVILDATPEEVWADVRHIDRHVEWMGDAEAIVFTSPSHEGVGTTFDCVTKVGPIRMTDKMRVTSWEEQRSIGVRHEGIVSGEGVFLISGTADGKSEFAWEETLRFPWLLGGPIGARIGAPILKRVWRTNLKKLQQRFC